MKVILREPVKNLGPRNAVVEVSDGYARNFLFPRNLAVPATDKQLKSIEKLHAVDAHRDDRRHAAAEAQQRQLEAASVTIRAKAGESGRLFGSVTAQQIATALKEQHGIEVDRKQVELSDPIRLVGDYTVTVHLLGDLRATLRVEVPGG